MKEVLKTNDLILISRIRSILSEAGIKNEILDDYASNIEGSISAIQRRIIVSNDDYNQSKRLINIIIDNGKI